MASWWLTSLILCGYGFFKELRPSEPFITEYLIGPWKNLTAVEVYQDVYPVWTYSYMALLLVVFLVTDFFRYKPVIVVEGIAYMATWAMLIWTFGIPSMQLMQVLYGVACSTEVAYYTYIYAQVPASKFQKVTSYTRAAILTGRCASGVLAQYLVYMGVADYYSLNYISFASVCVATVMGICLPSVRTSIYFHRLQQTDHQMETEDDIKKEHGSTEALNQPRRPFSVLCRDAYTLLFQDLVTSFKTETIVKWSIWWAFATCGNFQVGNYIQPLWETIYPWHEGDIYNGLIEASATFLGAVCAFGVGYIHLNWELLGEATLAVMSVLEGAALYCMSCTDDIWVAYCCYIFFRMSYQTMITIVSYQVAKLLRPDSYGLVFGMNTFMALLFQTILTVVVVENVGFALKPNWQFTVYGFYFFSLGFLFLFMWVLTVQKIGMEQIWKQGIWERKEYRGEDPSEPNQPPTGTTEAL